MHSLSRPSGPADGVAQACISCPLQKHCFLANPVPDETGDCADTVRRRHPVARGRHLYRRDTPFTALYLVCTGSLKTQRETVNGDLVVTGFFLPGDIVGIDAIADRHHPADAVATTDTQVCQLNFERLLSHCAQRPGLQSWVIGRIGFYVRRRDSDLSWSSGLQSHLRVLRFFLELYGRLASEQPGIRDDVPLPMRKQDIARYLRMTPETLSRNLTQLQRAGLLYVRKDRFRVPDVTRAEQVTRL